MKFNIYGRKLVQVVREEGTWTVFYLGAEGKKRLATDLIIPAEIPANKIQDYLAILFHESATPGRDEVTLIKDSND